MRAHIAQVVLLANCLGFASMVGAQNTTTTRFSDRFTDTQNGLSLDSALRQALEREPTLRSVRSEVDVAQGKRLQATLRPNPSLSVEQRQEPTSPDSQTMAQIQWPLDLFRRPARVAVADRAIEVSERAVEDRTRLLIADVRGRYGDAAAAIRDLSLADDAVELISRQFDLLRQRASEGSVPVLERDKLEVELRRYEADRLLASGRVEASMIALKRTIGMAIDTPVQLRDRLENLLPSTVVSDSGIRSSPNASVAAERADVRMTDAEVRLAQARIDEASAQGRYDVTLFGGYMRMDTRFAQLGFNQSGQLQPVQGTFNYVSGGAMVTVPFRNRNQGDIAAARAERAGAQARRDTAQLAAEADIAAAEARDAAARRALAVTASVVDLAGKNLDVVRQAYELGRTTAADVLMEQRRYLDVQRAQTETMKTSYEARVALMQARGDR
jgi:cobalt-zinc-cadmium efflux system outer membrane protein